MEEKQVKRRKRKTIQMFRRVHTRKIDRMVARHMMEVHGFNHRAFRYQWRQLANMI